MNPWARSSLPTSSEGSLNFNLEQAPDQRKENRLKKLRGSALVLLGFLLSPLCWWNDLVFNLPVAYGFGYLCKLINPDFLTLGTIAGYWISNLVGIVLMHFGVADAWKSQGKEPSLKRELLAGAATSTAYTLLIVVILQLGIIDLSAILPSDLAAGVKGIWPFSQHISS
jgi:hypothetical protein